MAYSHLRYGVYLRLLAAYAQRVLFFFFKLNVSHIDNRIRIQDQNSESEVIKCGNAEMEMASDVWFIDDGDSDI